MADSSVCGYGNAIGLNRGQFFLVHREPATLAMANLDTDLANRYI